MKQLLNIFMLTSIALMLSQCSCISEPSKVSENVYPQQDTIVAPNGSPTDDNAEGAAFTGYDYQGQQRSCEPAADDLICTMVFTPADEYAAKCEEAGHQVVTCGCHDHLCSENISAKAD